LFFLVGWLIFRNIDHLEVMVRGWRWQLALGLLLTMPYFYYYEVRHPARICDLELPSANDSGS
jgi:hypothetical protein